MKQYWSMTEGVFNCLGDHRRTHAFARAIRNTVRRDSVVADLGSGSGIIALFAAKADARSTGTAKGTA
jgi:predicted RNA methylase